MALPVLDGNQSATTLSSVVTGGEHIVAHSVVCLGSTAIANITNAVSGSVVSISNFPSTQIIAGTVTVGGIGGSVTIPVRLFAEAEGGPSSGQDTLVLCDSSGQLLINAKSGGVSVLGYDGNAFVSVKQVSGSSVTIGSLPAISGTVTANLGGYSQTAVSYASSSVTAIPVALQTNGVYGGTLLAYNGANTYLRVGLDAVGPNSLAFGGSVPISGTVTVGNSVTIGSLPAISGTVTVGNNNFNIKATTVQDGSNFFYITNAANYRLFSPTGASKTLNNIFGATPSWIVAFSDSVTWVSDSGTEVAYFHDGTQWTLDDLTTPAGTLALNGSVFITNVSGVSGINILNGFTATQLGSPLVDSGATRVQIYSSTVTAAAPNGSLTTRFGTPTTANVSFATAAVTNSDRKYLLIQNVTTGSNVITVGIGFTPTTTRGIQLTAGAGITFESSYIPTGAVYVLSSVTASNFTILEA